MEGGACLEEITGMHTSSQVKSCSIKAEVITLSEPGRIQGLDHGIRYTAVSSHPNSEQEEVPLQGG